MVAQEDIAVITLYRGQEALLKKEIGMKYKRVKVIKFCSLFHELFKRFDESTNTRKIIFVILLHLFLVITIPSLQISTVVFTIPSVSPSLDIMIFVSYYPLSADLNGRRSSRSREECCPT